MVLLPNKTKAWAEVRVSLTARSFIAAAPLVTFRLADRSWTTINQHTPGKTETISEKGHLNNSFRATSLVWGLPFQFYTLSPFTRCQDDYEMVCYSSNQLNGQEYAWGDTVGTISGFPRVRSTKHCENDQYFLTLDLFSKCIYYLSLCKRRRLQMRGSF